MPQETPPDPRPSPRKQAREVTLTLKRRVRETADTSTLVFEKPEGLPPYLAGQFLTLDPHQFQVTKPWVSYLEAAKGRKELARAYSLSSAPHEPDLAVTVKEEPFAPGVQPYPPLLSPYLVHGIAPGTQVRAVCFTGPYVLPEDIEAKTRHVVHVVAGSGVIPNFSIVKDSLRRHPTVHHTFIYSNKTWDDICFREALEALETDSQGRLVVVHTLTRETDSSHFGPRVRQGRVGLELLREYLREPESAFVYVCGPAITSYARRAAIAAGTQATPRFLEQTLDHLEQLGVPKAHVRREAYG